MVRISSSKLAQFASVFVLLAVVTVVSQVRNVQITFNKSSLFEPDSYETSASIETRGVEKANLRALRRDSLESGNVDNRANGSEDKQYVTDAHNSNDDKDNVVEEENATEEQVDATEQQQDDATEQQQEPAEHQQDATEGQQEPTEQQQEPTKEQQDATEGQQEPTEQQQDTTDQQQEPTKEQQDATEQQQDTTDQQQEPTKEQQDATEQQQEPTEQQQDTTDQQQEPTKEQQDATELQVDTIKKQVGAVEESEILTEVDNKAERDIAQIGSQQFRLYDDFKKIGIIRADKNPGNKMQRRKSVQQLPGYFHDEPYFALDAMLEPWNNQVSIMFAGASVHPLNEVDRYYQLPFHRRLPKVSPKFANESTTEFYIRDCRVVSLEDGEIYGNQTYQRTTLQDHSNLYWTSHNKTKLAKDQGQKKIYDAADEAPEVVQCGACSIYSPQMRVTTHNDRTWKLNCKLDAWVLDLINTHAGMGVFEFDIGVVDLTADPVSDPTSPSLPGIVLDVPLTSYSHHAFRYEPFKGNPTVLYPTAPTRERKIAACLSFSSNNPAVVTLHKEELRKHGVDHFLYLPMVATSMGRKYFRKFWPELEDTEGYIKKHLKLKRTVDGPDTTVSSPWLNGWFDFPTTVTQLFLSNVCYSYAMATGYDWVVFQDIDEFPFVTKHAPQGSLVYSTVAENYNPDELCYFGLRRQKMWTREVIELRNKTMTTTVEFYGEEFEISDSEKHLKYVAGKHLSFATVHFGVCDHGPKVRIATKLPGNRLYIGLLHARHLNFEDKIDEQKLALADSSD